MKIHIGHRLSVAQKLLLMGSGFVALALPLVHGIVNAPPSQAQSLDGPNPSFEVISINPDTSEEELSPEEITAHNEQSDIYEVAVKEKDETYKEEEYEAAQKEYTAYIAAVEEPDLLKRGEMLIEFIKTYPKSDLIETYVKPTYERLLSDCSDNQQFEELLVLAENWLELYPDNIRAIAFAYNAAVQLKQDEKSVQYALKIYEIQPTAGLAYSVAQTYERLGNFEEYVKWCEVYFTYPKSNGDYTERFKIMSKYADRGNLDKAAEYAEKTLEVLKSAAKPDAAGQENIPTIKRICNHVIGIHYFEEDKFQEAIKYFENALKAKCYQEGFYYIARCYWGLNNLELANDFFSAAVIFGGVLTEKAKEYKEQLYKQLHNNTLIGIEEVHKRAQALIDSYSAADAAQE